MVAGCSSDGDNPDGTKSENVLKLAEGRCLLVDDALPAEVENLPVIDCDKPHTHEIFATVDDTENDVYPGLTTLGTFANAACYGAFENYVGISPYGGETSLFVTWMVPSLDGWNEKDDRTVLCLLGRQDGGQLDRSVKGLAI